MRNSAVSKTTQCIWIISIPHAIYLYLEPLHLSLKFMLFSFYFLIINYEIQWLKELAIFYYLWICIIRVVYWTNLNFTVCIFPLSGTYLLGQNWDYFYTQ